MRSGTVTALGVNWGKITRLTNSSHNVKTPDIAELEDHRIIVVWTDIDPSGTGSQIFYFIVDPNESQPPTPISLTPNSRFARNARVSANGLGKLNVVYEDDKTEIFEVYSISIEEGGTGANLTISEPVKVSNGEKAINPVVTASQEETFFLAWEAHALDTPGIAGCEMVDNVRENYVNYTDARNSCRYSSTA